MKRLSVFILAGMVAAAAFGAEPAKATTERQTLQEQNTAKTAAKPEQTGDEDAPMTFGDVALFCAGKLICYVPNLIMDSLDIWSLQLKFGPTIGAGFRITRAFGLGAEAGMTIGAFKDVNRQYGFAFEKGYQAQLPFVSAEAVSVVNPIGSVQQYWQHGSNFPLCTNEIYNIYSGARDYWAIEAYASALVGARVAIHPIDIADFITGIFFFDLKNDDIRLKLY